MRRLLPLALLVAGCAAAAPPEAKVVDPTPTPMAQETKLPPAAKATGNPNRIHQLKDLKKVDLSLKGHPVHAWVMDDEPKQEEGMMFLTDGEVKVDEGMLFAFSEVQPKMRPGGGPSGFWMHNTLIPLDIIYLSPAGKVLNVAHGKVQDDTNLPAAGDYKNVIELKAGTAARFGLKTGDLVVIPMLPKP